MQQTENFIPSLDVLVEDPARVKDWNRDDVLEGLAQITTIQGALLVRLLALPVSTANGTAPKAEPDRMLTVKQAAERIGMSPKWIYQRSDKLPFTRRVGRTILINEHKLEAWMSAKR